MNRSRRILAFALAAALLPVAGRAQPAARQRHVVILLRGPGSPEFGLEAKKRWAEMFAQHGFHEGADLRIDIRQPARKDWESDVARVVAQRPDVICVSGPGLALLVKRATSEIPIVFFSVSDPVASGLISQIRSPAGNITGVTSAPPELLAKRLQIFRQINPKASRLLVLSSDVYGTDRSGREALARAASALGFSLVENTVHPSESSDVLVRLIRDSRVDAFVPLEVWHSAESWANIQGRASVPGLFTNANVARAGGLLALGEVRWEGSKRAAVIAARILRGEKPGAIPVDQLTSAWLVVNAKTAQHMGMSIPSSIRVMADEVIE